jgi:hypothetical protein
MIKLAETREITPYPFKHLVRCRSQRGTHLLYFVPDISAQTPKQLVAWDSHCAGGFAAGGFAAAGELKSSPVPMRVIAKKRCRVMVEPPTLVMVEPPILGKYCGNHIVGVKQFTHFASLCRSPRTQRYNGSAASALANAGPPVTSCGGRSAPCARDHRPQPLDNRRNSAQLPPYLAAGRVLSNSPMKTGTNPVRHWSRP